jgi:hypothetical protein
VRGTALRGRPRPRRQDRFAASLVAVFVTTVIVLSGLLYIEIQFRPEGSLFGRPSRIPACNRSYLGPGRGVTRAEIEAGLKPGFEPTVLEPTIGEVPLAPWVDQRSIEAGQVCDTVIYLHLRPDLYVPYGLEGGP